MRVTIDTLLKGEVYPPLPGTEYVVGDSGSVVKLRVPTIELLEEVDKAREEAKGSDWADIRVAKVVTVGDWPASGIIPNMATRVVEDFFTAARPHLRPRAAFSPKSEEAT